MNAKPVSGKKRAIHPTLFLLLLLGGGAHARRAACPACPPEGAKGACGLRFGFGALGVPLGVKATARAPGCVKEARHEGGGGPLVEVVEQHEHAGQLRGREAVQAALHHARVGHHPLLRGAVAEEVQAGQDLRPGPAAREAGRAGGRAGKRQTDGCRTSGSVGGLGRTCAATDRLRVPSSVNAKAKVDDGGPLS